MVIVTGGAYSSISKWNAITGRAMERTPTGRTAQWTHTRLGRRNLALFFASCRQTLSTVELYSPAASIRNPCVFAYVKMNGSATSLLMSSDWQVWASSERTHIYDMCVLAMWPLYVPLPPVQRWQACHDVAVIPLYFTTVTPRHSEPRYILRSLPRLLCILYVDCFVCCTPNPRKQRIHNQTCVSASLRNDKASPQV